MNTTIHVSDVKDVTMCLESVGGHLQLTILAFDKDSRFHQTIFHIGKTLDGFELSASAKVRSIIVDPSKG